MIKLNKILVPTDFSEGAGSAYPVANELIDNEKGKIDFIHVIPTLKYFNESLKRLGIPLDMNKDVYPKVIEEAEEKMKEIMQRSFKPENIGDVVVRVGQRPAEVIASYAQENEYDMIVLGARGRDESKFLRGGVTERVIRRSRVPVFSVDRHFKKEVVENVVMTTDSSELSIAAFPLAVAIADMYGASLTLFYVIELYGGATEEIPIQPAKGEAVSSYEGIVDRINTYLSKRKIEDLHIRFSGLPFEDEVVITDGDESRAIPLYTKVVKGISAHYEIEHYVAEAADLIVMATHGRSGFAHLVLGSTAEKVAQYSKKSVITIRPDERDFTKK